MAGPEREGSPLPVLVAKVLEERRFARRQREIQEQEAVPARDRVTMLVRATVPDPRPTQEERDRVLLPPDYLSVVYPFELNGEIVEVRISNNHYPRGPLEDAGEYAIGIGEGLHLQISQWELSKYKDHGPNQKFDDQDLDNFNGLLQAIEDGIADGSVKPIIESPRPYYERPLTPLTSSAVSNS